MTTQCNIFKDGKLLFGNLRVDVRVTEDQKTMRKQWNGILYLSQQEALVFFTNPASIYDIELSDGRKGTFFAQPSGGPVLIIGQGPLV